MQNLLKKINAKINGLIINLTATGVLLIMSAILIVWTDFFIRLMIGLLALVAAYMFFYLAYKVWWFKKEIKKHLKF